MFLQPKRTKFKKQHKGRIRPKQENKANSLHFGFYGIQSLEKGTITARQIEAVRRTLTNYTKRQVKIWIKAFPDYPKTSKALGVRMGRGKGNIDFWVAKVNKGTILFEVTGKDLNLIQKALMKAKAKISVNTRVIRQYEELE